MKRDALFMFLLAGFVLIGSIPAGAQEPGSAAAATSFNVARLVITSAVQNREPADNVSNLPATAEKAYCFLEATEISTDTAVTFVWSLDGKEVHRYSLNLAKGGRWRTYAEISLRNRQGSWKVELVGAGENIIKSVSFKVP